MTNNIATVPYSKSFSFIFKSDPDLLYPLLMEIVSVVQDELPAERYSFTLETKCKLILTELLTNALKHSCATETEFNIVISEHSLEISKKDHGKAFYLPAFKQRDELHWPLDEWFTGEKIIVYEDDMCGLYAHITHTHKVVFVHNEYPITIPPRPRDLLEHFGLIILTKAADEFIYIYDPATQANIFSTVIFFDEEKEAF